MSIFFMDTINIGPVAATPTYKLIYFNGTGRAEPVKLMFAYKQIEYEDIRINMDEWEAFKPKTPYGHLPLLQVNSVIIAESYAIMRYVAKQLGLVGKNDFEAAKADEITDYLKPLYDHKSRREIFFDSDLEKQYLLKEKFATEVVPPYYSRLDQILRSNGGNFFVGCDLTWTDFVVAYFLDEIERHSCHKAVVGEYPTLAKHRTDVNNLPGVKEWIEMRPKGEF